MQQLYRFAQFEVRPADRLLLADGIPASLGARAFDLLLCLLEHHPRMVSKEDVLNHVWPGLVVEENNLSVQVSALRKLLGSQAITTVAGRGYRFSIDLQEAPVTLQEALSLKGKPTIAVLPFKVLSEEPRVRLLADGLTEDVIALLARVPGFLLISHASSSGFRGGSTPLPDIARQLAVRYVVEGSVRPVGGQLRVSTQLTEATTGHVLWNSRFESALETAEDLQDGIVRGILAQLEPELTRAEIAHIRRQRPDNQDAWSHYHQAVGAIALKGWSEAALADARALLLKSVTLDPAFGLGHAHYALLTALGCSIGLLPQTPELERDVLQAAQRAMTLDEGSAEVLGYAGCALSDIGQGERGRDVLQQALEIDPSNAQARVALGASLAMMGQLDVGIAEMRQGMKISPRDRRLSFWGWALGVFLLRSNQAEEALAEARRSSQRDTSFYLARVLEAATLAALGRDAEVGSALAAARQLRSTLTLQEIALTHGKRAGERLAQHWSTR